MSILRFALVCIMAWGAFHFVIAPPAPVLETDIAETHPWPAERPLPTIDAEPMQFDLADDGRPFAVGETDIHLTPKATFELRARVLSTRNYRLGRESRVSPRDLALGWGPMADDEILEGIRITQSGRWYTWRAGTLPMPRQAIDRHSSNMHMIAGNPAAMSDLKRVRTGDEITLRGHLVDVADGDGGIWRTSTSRTETGAGACEIVLIESLIIH